MWHYLACSQNCHEYSKLIKWETIFAYVLWAFRQLSGYIIAITVIADIESKIQQHSVEQDIFLQEPRRNAEWGDENFPNMVCEPSPQLANIIRLSPKFLTVFRENSINLDKFNMRELKFQCLLICTFFT